MINLRLFQVNQVAIRVPIHSGAPCLVSDDIASVIITGGSRGRDSFGARWCAFSSRPTIPPRAGPSGELSPQLTACFTSAAIFASSVAVNFVSA